MMLQATAGMARWKGTACEADTVELTRDQWYALLTEGRGGPVP